MKLRTCDYANSWWRWTTGRPRLHNPRQILSASSDTISSNTATSDVTKSSSPAARSREYPEKNVIGPRRLSGMHLQHVAVIGNRGELPAAIRHPEQFSEPGTSKSCLAAVSRHISGWPRAAALWNGRLHQARGATRVRLPRSRVGVVWPAANVPTRLTALPVPLSAMAQAVPRS